MNKKLKTSIKIAAAVFASAVVICLATPHTVHTDGGTAHGVDFPVKAAVVTTLETSTTVTTGTTSTSTSTSTISTTTSTSTTLSSTTTTVVTEEIATTAASAETTVVAPETAEPERPERLCTGFLSCKHLRLPESDECKRFLGRKDKLVVQSLDLQSFESLFLRYFTFPIERQCAIDIIIRHRPEDKISPFRDIDTIAARADKIKDIQNRIRQ